MKSLLAGLFFAILFVGAGIYFYNKESKDADERVAKMVKFEDEQLDNIKATVLVNSSTNIAGLVEAEATLAKLSKERAAALAPYIALKKSLLYFNEAEGFLMRAVEIETAVGGDSQSINPLAQASLNKAIDLYDKARKEVELLKDTNDANFNFSANYLKGEIYYRLLEFVADRESAVEIFNQTLTYYKMALRSKPGDINTVVNIELLIKNQNRLLGNAADPQQKKKQMLTSKKFGVNKSSGN